MARRFETHTHSDASNIRLLDCINKPKDLVKRAREIGLSGFAITDHDCLGNHVEFNLLQKKIQEEDPDFKIALGNEIYLCPDREKGQRYYHYILIAKNKEGYRQLRLLSSRAWLNSYYDRGMERVVTTYDDLKEIVSESKGNLVALNACVGGELAQLALRLTKAEKHKDEEEKTFAHNRIIEFMKFNIDLFGDDWYVEIAPGRSAEQVTANKRLIKIAEAFGRKVIVATDAHYLRKEDSYIHEAYLNSKGGEREVASFYEYAYLQSEDEIIENLRASGLEGRYDEFAQNSMEIYDKIENYSLEHKPIIPKVEPIEYKKRDWGNELDKYPTLKMLFNSEDAVERQWVNDCWLSLESHFGSWRDVLDYVERLETEADIIKDVGRQLEDNMFSYFITLKHYIDFFWDNGSIVGPGRGSATGFLSNYLLGITQLDPIKNELPYWRFLTKERAGLPDVDVDLCPVRRPAILSAIKKERAEHFSPNLDERSKEELGVVFVATYGREKTKSAILTACRGYRSEEFLDGIDSDTASYMASLIESERGFLWSLHDTVYGDKEKGRKPNRLFVEEVEQYPGLLDVMMGIEGLINKRSSHASGVIFANEDPYEVGCFMKTPKGEVITQWDLASAEVAGMTKYDALATEITTKLIECLSLLEQYGEIESATLREQYNKYLHPEKVDINKPEIWEALGEGSVMDCFQFSTDVGLLAAKKLKPKNILEMTSANCLMRLMPQEKGGESPLDKYARFKEHFPEIWEREMDGYSLTKEERDLLRPTYEPTYGCPSMQEEMMLVLMNVIGLSFKDVDKARKTVAKKKMDEIPSLRAKVLSSEKVSQRLAQYVWDTAIVPQLGYSFSRNHSVPYSYVGVQSLILATQFDPIYWNTACLIVNSGSLEVDEDKASNYGKVAKALGETIARGINISLVDINKSEYGFRPDVENQSILFGLKALGGVNADMIEKIKQGRPYKSIKDFMQRCPLNKRPMIALIKSGAFDELTKDWAKECNAHPRTVAMTYYLSVVSEPKRTLNMRNWAGLDRKGMIPDSLLRTRKTFALNKTLKDNKYKEFYIIPTEDYLFFKSTFSIDDVSFVDNRNLIPQSIWDKIYKSEMEVGKQWIASNLDSLLKEFNASLFKELWDKYASGSLSAWEMEAMCFYHSPHELSSVKTDEYGIVEFFDLPEEPIVERRVKRNGKDIPIFVTHKIMGTVLDKNDTKSTISLLTLKGVVSVKLSKEYYAMFSRQLSEKQEDGTKRIVERGWFKRGTKLLLTGVRQGDVFRTKTYKHTPTHQLYKILSIDKDGMIELEHERAFLGEMI